MGLETVVGFSKITSSVLSLKLGVGTAETMCPRSFHNAGYFKEETKEHTSLLTGGRAGVASGTGRPGEKPVGLLGQAQTCRNAFKKPMEGSG